MMPSREKITKNNEETPARYTPKKIKEGDTYITYTNIKVHPPQTQTEKILHCRGIGSSPQHQTKHTLEHSLNALMNE